MNALQGIETSLTILRAVLAGFQQPGVQIAADVVKYVQDAIVALEAVQNTEVTKSQLDSFKLPESFNPIH